MSCFIDIHSHHENISGLTILNLSPREILSLQPTDNKFYSTGIHPWHISTDCEIDLQILTEAAKSKQVIAIGECGLDKLCSSPFELQEMIFRKQIELAEATNKPLIIHCVKAFNELISLKKEIDPVSAWIIHGFRGKKALAEDLIRHGCYLSFGKNIFQLKETISTVPLARLLLETDDESIEIRERYADAALALGISAEQLQSQLKENFARLFPFI